MKDTLLKIRKDMEDIMGQWDGNESGMGEDRAGAAKEAIEYIDTLIDILESDALGYL